MSEHQKKFNGLWKGKTAWYVSKGFSKTQLLKTMPNKFRLIVRENIYHHDNDDGTPRFIFTFVDAETAENLRFGTPEQGKDYSFTAEELQALINEIASAVGGDSEYGMWLIDDFHSIPERKGRE